MREFLIISACVFVSAVAWGIVINHDRLMKFILWAALTMIGMTIGLTLTGEIAWTVEIK